MEEKQLWSEVNKIIRNCERRGKRTSDKPRRKRKEEPEAEAEAPSSSSRQKKYDIFTLAVEDILRRESEVNMDITLKGDMARAFHITMAIGKYLWNKDEDVMIQRIMQAGVEQIINEYNTEIMLKEAKRFFKPMLRELLREIEDEERP